VGFIPRSLRRIKKVFQIDTPSAYSGVVHLILLITAVLALINIYKFSKNTS